MCFDAVADFIWIRVEGFEEVSQSLIETTEAMLNG